MGNSFDKEKYRGKIAKVGELINMVENSERRGIYPGESDHQTLLNLIQLSGYFRVCIARYERGEEFTEEDYRKMRNFEAKFDNLINKIE